MRKFSKYILPFVLILLLLFIFDDASAQCAMCKASAENGIKEGQTVSKGMNVGILYLLSIPYLLIGTIGGATWYLKRKFKAEQDIE